MDSNEVKKEVGKGKMIFSICYLVLVLCFITFLAIMGFINYRNNPKYNYVNMDKHYFYENTNITNVEKYTDTNNKIYYKVSYTTYDKFHKMTISDSNLYEEDRFTIIRKDNVKEELDIKEGKQYVSEEGAMVIPYLYRAILNSNRTIADKKMYSEDSYHMYNDMYKVISTLKKDNKYIMFSDNNAQIYDIISMLDKNIDLTIISNNKFKESEEVSNIINKNSKIKLIKVDYDNIIKEYQSFSNKVNDFYNSQLSTLENSILNIRAERKNIIESKYDVDDIKDIIVQNNFKDSIDLEKEIKHSNRDLNYDLVYKEIQIDKK